VKTRSDFYFPDLLGSRFNDSTVSISEFQLFASGTPAALFRSLLPLGERKALCLFPASRAFLNVVSTLAISHKASTLTLSPPVPSGFAASR